MAGVFSVAGQAENETPCRGPWSGDVEDWGTSAGAAQEWFLAEQKLNRDYSLMCRASAARPDQPGLWLTASVYYWRPLQFVVYY